MGRHLDYMSSVYPNRWLGVCITRHRTVSIWKIKKALNRITVDLSSRHVELTSPVSTLPLQCPTPATDEAGGDPLSQSYRSSP